jgi:cyclopropane fatty-acyl-phospholipid synthase-like methyltransferase
MIVKNFHNQAQNFYHTIYNKSYWCQEDIPGELRWEDEWPAVCYAHGIYNVILPTEHEQFFNEVHEQIEFLQTNMKRTPKSILEIGSGRGEVSCTMSHMGYPVTTVDVNDNSERFHRIYSKRWFGSETNDTHTLLIGDLRAAQQHLNLSNIDTIIMVESIEHIFADEWWEFFNFMLPTMKQNHTQLNITNLKGYWPLGTRHDCDEHVSLIDEKFYDQLAEQSQTVLYRDRSHISLQY